jgi:hypothetical protein
MDNNKGKPCLYKPILCQEGWCDGCYIALLAEGKIDEILTMAEEKNA